MADEPAKKPDWAIPFLARLCIIGWVCVVLYEAFDFVKPIRQLCLLFGVWACAITIIHGLILFLTRRRALILVLVLITVPPAIHFTNVIKNIAKEKKWFEPHDQKTAPPMEAVTESKEDSSEKPPTP